MANPAQQLRDTADAVARLGSSSSDLEALDDDTLLAAQRLLSEHRRLVDTYSTWIAGQIAHRSRRDLGYTGLAQRTGFLSPEALIQSVSGSTRAEAAKFVRVGALVVDAATPDAAPAPWLAPVGRAVATGRVSADAAEAIRRGLGESDATITTDQLLAAAETLLTLDVDADELFRRARRLRDELDEAGIAARERDRRAQRYLRIFARDDGMVGGSFLLDPEDGGLLTSALDAVMSPRRGGPRFVEPDAAASAEDLLADPRTNDQLAADTLIEMVRLAVDADPGTLFGSRRPAVRVLVRAEALESRAGHARLEGHHDPVSLETADRHACDAGIVGVKFDDDGQCVNVGRDQRLFTERQRIGLSVRDGGCRFPGCDRPPSWCEAHHIDQWHRDRGRTDVAAGVLLCRRHHLLLHNNHWNIARQGAEYWLVPPRAVDPQQRRIPMPSRSPLVGSPPAVSRLVSSPPTSTPPVGDPPISMPACAPELARA